jgi:DNA helicase-2/ATP-dependent DNA helicase PcrA
LIYPTKPILDFILNNKDLDGMSRAKFYVAITRARYSVGIVYNFKDSDSLRNIQKWTY